MPDEWVCECGHTTPIDPGDSSCPNCNGKMTKITDIDDDLAKGDKYDDDELEALDPMDDFEGLDAADEERSAGSKPAYAQDDDF